MKRVLTFATTGLFVTGLALMPLSAQAADVAGGKDGKMAPAASMTAPGVTPGTGTVAKPADKPADKTVTTAPAAKTGTTTAPSTGSSGTTTKPAG